MTEQSKRRVETEAGYVMVEFDMNMRCWIWRCEWGHLGFDFEGQQEALDDFGLHDCRRTC